MNILDYLEFKLYNISPEGSVGWLKDGEVAFKGYLKLRSQRTVSLWLRETS